MKIQAKNKYTGEVREFGILELSVQRIYFMCGEKNINFTEDKFNSEWEVVDITGTNPVEESLKKTFENLPTQSIEDKKTMNKEDIIEEFNKQFVYWVVLGSTLKDGSVKRFRFNVSEDEQIENILNWLKQKLSDLEQSTREKLMSEQGANSMCEYWYKKGKDEALQEVRENIENKKKEAKEIATISPNNFTALGAIATCIDLLTSLQRNDSEARLKDK